MKTARKKFLFAAMLAILILLTSLLSVINIVNFTMASSDADRITEEIERNQGTLGKEFRSAAGQGQFPANGRFGPMGPGAPDMGPSLRYYTVAFDGSGNASLTAYNITAVTEQEALSWAKSLAEKSGALSEDSFEARSGWTRGTYRYRVYEMNGISYVTVVDQGREMLSSYRILIISVIGEAAALVIGGLLLLFVSRRLFRPLEEADRRQKTFLQNAEKEFKVPLTVISADTELLEREHGADEKTQSINRQVGKMKNLVRTLGSFAVFEDEKETAVTSPVSELVKECAIEKEKLLAENGITLKQEIEDGITVEAEADTLRRMTEELLENAGKFAESEAVLRLKKENGRLLLETENDTALPDGEYPQAFDRFTRLVNAEEKEGAGLGLSYIKEQVQELGGRVSARAKDGRFTVRLSLDSPERRKS